MDALCASLYSKRETWHHTSDASVLHIQKSFDFQFDIFVYVLWCVYICVHAHWRLEVSIIIFHLSAWDIVSHRTWNLSVLPDCLDKDLMRPHFPVLMVQVCTAVPDFTCLPGNWTQLLLITKQTLYLPSHLSSTQFCFCVGDILLFVFFLRKFHAKVISQ